MRKISRFALVLLMGVAMLLAAVQLRVQETPAIEVLITGLYTIGAVLVLFAVLVGVGKGLGRLVGQRTDQERDGP